ncbi:MAG: hypothetical protein ACFBSD_13665 [Paracoccaceae bacterium]
MITDNLGSHERAAHRDGAQIAVPVYGQRDISAPTVRIARAPSKIGLANLADSVRPYPYLEPAAAAASLRIVEP